MFLDVDEAGVKAAVVTGIRGGVTSIPSFPPLAVRVVVDRPFMFLIYDTVNNIPVFLGRMADPVPQ